MKRKLQQIDFNGWALLTDEARAYVRTLEGSDADEAIRQNALGVLEEERVRLIADLALCEGRIN